MNISNYRYGSLVSGSEDNDYISNHGVKSTINALGGNDSIYNDVQIVTIDAGNGNDYINNNSRGRIVTIIGGAGDDSIYNRGDQVVFQYSEGNDFIRGFNATSSLNIVNADYTTAKSGNDIIVTVGNNKITLYGAATLSTVNIRKVFDDIEKALNVRNENANVSLVGTNNDDTIANTGDNVTITAQGGNDFISNSGANVLFNYTAGEGNDYITGFRADSTLSIAGGGYSTQQSGSDIIVTVGDNKITLDGAATLSNPEITNAPINIVNEQGNKTVIGSDARESISNAVDNVKIQALGGNDTVDNRGSKASIDGGNGNDSISNAGDNATIVGSAGNDSISNSGANVTISDGAGNDTVYNSGNNVTINGSAGDDSIDNDGTNVTYRYNKGDGNDILYGFRNGTQLFISEGEYYSQVKGDDVVITVGDEQITLDGAAVMSRPDIKNPPVNISNFQYRKDRKQLVVGTDANESVYNDVSKVTIQANGGNDSITNRSSNVSIEGGSGNDSIQNNGANVTINAGNGDDTIRHFANYNILIFGGEGNDSIYNDAYIRNNKGIIGTISGGTGDDTIVNNKNGLDEIVFRYREGDGNDVIEGFGNKSTLDLGGANYASVKSGDDIVLTVGDGKITLKGAMNLSTVNIDGVIDQPLETENRKDDALVVGGNYGDHITNTGKNVTIDGIGGNDTITNSGTNVSIEGGNGEDSVENQSSEVSISGGLGNDSIRNSGFNVSMSGGEGNDSIINNGANVTIEGGTDRDTIEIGNSTNALIKYKAGDGNDVIRGFRADSTLLIAGGIPAVTTTRGNDIIVTVNDGRITLQGAANLSNANILETPVNIHNSARKRSIRGTNANDTIINTGDKVSIAALKGNDSINNNASYVTIDGGEGADNISNTGRNVTILGGTGNNTIYNNAARILVRGSEDNDSIFNHGEGNTILGEDGNDTIENYTNSNRVSIAAGAGDDSVSNAGHNVIISGGEGNDTVSSDGTANSLIGGAGDDFISISGSYKNTILGGKGNDTINLDWGSNKALIQYNLGDGNDVIEGFNSTATLRIGDGSDTYDKAIEGDDMILTVGEENITLKGAAKLAGVNIAGVTQLKVNNLINAASLIGDRLDDSIANSGHKVTISAVAGNDTIENTGRYVSISGGADTDNISNSNANFVSIDGDDGNDTISNNNGNFAAINGGNGDDNISDSNSNFVSIDGASGNDVISISGGVRNVISGGAGDDSIYVAQSENILIKHSTGDGNDVITGFRADSTLQIGESTDTYTATVSGSDIIVTVGEEKITLAGAANLETVNIIGTEIIDGKNINNSTKNIIINGNAGNDTITNRAENVTINGNAGNDSIQNGESRKNVMIDGGAGNDSIYNSGFNATIEAGAGDDSIYNSGSNVTISSGTGNDSIRNRGANVVFDYVNGDGNDVIEGFNSTSTLNISGLEYSTERRGNDVVVSVGGGSITIKNAATLYDVNIVQATKEVSLNIVNTDEEISVVGTAFDDTISNKGEYVTITAQGGNDSVYNQANSTTIDGGAGNDTVVNDYAFYSSIAGGEGSDVISVASSSQVTINAGKADDTINLSNSDQTFIEYNAGDGNDLITGFDEYSTLNIVKSEFTSAITGNDIVITVGEDKITLQGAATLSDPHIVSGTYATFTVKNSKVTCETDIPDAVIKNSYSFNEDTNSLVINSGLTDKAVKVKADDAAKVNWHYGSASLSSESTLQYQLADGTNNVTLTSKNYNDKITLSENATFNYGRIQAEVQENGTVSTKAANRISFENSTSANVTARRDYIIDVEESNITINDLPVNAPNGSGTVTVERNGLKFEGYGAQFADLEIAKESYFGKLAPMTVTYNSSEELYTVYNTACVKTLSGDFIKLTFDFKEGTEESTATADKYAYYKINDVAISTTKDENDISTIEVNDRTFKVQDIELDVEKIGRITLDDKVTFNGTEIKYDDVEINYAQSKTVSYTLDGKEVTINDAATVTTDEETRTINCEAGSYVINRRSFETTTALTFTADANQIKIPLSDAKTEIYFDGVKVSGLSGGKEIVFDLADDKVAIPDGAIIDFTCLDAVKLNLAAGTFTINGKKITTNTELEITGNKESIKVPLSENAVTINGAAITGTGEATIDNTNELFCSILLPNGAFVRNTSDNIYQLTGKDSSAAFGNANKKVKLTADDTTYVDYCKENAISVGHNKFMLEQVEIQGNDAWTIETAGADGINKITGIKNGATISTSTKYIDEGDLRFEVETNGAGTFTICGQKFTSTGNAAYVVYGNSADEIKVAPQGEEYADDDSEAAGKVYQFDTAGDYTVNGITFHAVANSKAKTITRGVEFDLSSGTFQYDGLTLEGGGTAQINRYNAKLISLTDGAKISGSDRSKYINRQFEINGAVEIIGKKFETDQQIRCGLIDVQDTIDNVPIDLKGFFVDDKYVQIQSDCYGGVKVVDKNITSIEGIKASAELTGNGLQNISMITTQSGEFKIHDDTYKISDDSDGVTFVTDSRGNISAINGLQGTVEGNFENSISVNGKAIHLTGVSSIKVTSDGEKITEIANVAGDTVTADGKTYRKDVRVISAGGTEKLTTSADGTIIFDGNKFEMSAGKTFTLDESGNISGINNTTKVLAAYSGGEENFGTIDLSTTDNLDEVIGDFSEGLSVNGVFVKVTDSKNFAVKNDAENIYIETTAPDTFTINGKTFETSADKTIFKLDANGNVAEIVTDKFYLYPEENAYLIKGDFNDEIIFNGKKFCVTGSNETTIFIGDETLLSVELVRNDVSIVNSGGASEINVSGSGNLEVGGKVMSTSDGFAGVLKPNSNGSGYSVDDFVGTMSGELGGLEILGVTVNSKDNFSVTSNGENITAVDNLLNGSFTCDDLDSLTIDGENIIFDNAEKVTLTVTNGKLKISDENASNAEEILDLEDAKTVSGKENLTLTGGEAVIVEDTSAKVNITASKGEDTIYTAGKHVDIDLKAGGATKIYAAEGKATVENYNAKSGAAFLTENENIGEAIEENSIAYDDGKLSVNSAQVTFADDTDSRLINFVDTDDATQKAGFVSNNSRIDASKETADLILVGGSDSTISGGKGSDTIYGGAGNLINAGAGKNLIKLNGDGESIIEMSGKDSVTGFRKAFEDGDIIKTSTENLKLQFDGENIVAKNGSGKMTLSGGTGETFTELLLLDGSETLKTYVAQSGENILINDEAAQAYYGKKSGVDFSGYSESLELELSENFYGINRVTVGGGLNTLIGSSANETLTGNSDGITEFGFSAGGGRDLIQNFNFDEDKINVSDAITDVKITKAGNVRMKVGIGDDYLTIADAQGKAFKVNDVVALVDKNITYDEAANYFVATARNATLTVNESAEIWLDGSHGKTFVGVKVLDASNAEGNTSLVGNDSDNTILAGNGDASLWGGNGGDDLLQGGAGKNTFFYTNGNDTIAGANDGDEIILSGVTLEQISGTSIATDAVTINFKDGGALQVNSAADVTYQLADGTKFSADHEQSAWLTRN